TMVSTGFSISYTSRNGGSNWLKCLHLHCLMSEQYFDELPGLQWHKYGTGGKCGVIECEVTT
ncbi:hypothetical protein ACT4GB_004498, partial [Escherichia coli]